MRLERAIPVVVQKLHACGEVLSEECVEALAKIGTSAAAGAVAEGWSDADWTYRLYASDGLDKTHSDTTVRKCLELLSREAGGDRIEVSEQYAPTHTFSLACRTARRP